MFFSKKPTVRYLHMRGSCEIPSRVRIVYEYHDAYMIAWEETPKEHIGIYTPHVRHRTLRIKKDDERILGPEISATSSMSRR